MHLNGKSTREIADELKMKKNTVIKILKYHKLLKQASGVEFEELVARFFENNGSVVERQRGDMYFDLLIDGKKVDVKSAILNKKENRSHFEIKHRKSKGFNARKIDYYILVFKSLKNMPAYKLYANEVFHKSISLGNPKESNSKYNLYYIGLLK